MATEEYIKYFTHMQDSVRLFSSDGLCDIIIVHIKLFLLVDNRKGVECQRISVKEYGKGLRITFGQYRQERRPKVKTEPIETPRLILRGFTKEDALWAYSIWNDPVMGEYLLDEAKEGIDPEYIKKLEVLGEDEECCYLIPVIKASNQRVGTCSFMISEDKKVYDIAYCVHRDFQCRGYATEMARGMMEYARVRGAEKVTILVNKGNIPSNRVAAKCGGRIAAEKTYKKRGTDAIMEEYLYEVLL